ncbi:MAG: DUF4833 domain-containing protein [Saprospiraceae bacterium]|jgi:hypothetical protein|nr:DUF4833 domain-containing protein [Saprospiraceae bacterium]
MFFVQSEQFKVVSQGQDGRPDNYPIIEPYPELLFYIQRNQNFNTVIYEINQLPGGILNLNEPMKISWVYFEDNNTRKIQEINPIQKKLAYGYRHKLISNEMIDFKFVSYDGMTFYLAKNDHDQFSVFTKFKNEFIELDHIYVYAEDLGVFPQVKFVEFFGKSKSGLFYNKLVLD